MLTYLFVEFFKKKLGGNNKGKSTDNNQDNDRFHVERFHNVVDEMRQLWANGIEKSNYDPI